MTHAGQLQRKLTVAIIGAGWIACGRHVPAWRCIPATELRFIVDTDADVARRRAAELGLEVASYSHVLNDPMIDVVDICVPHDLHAPMALEAIAAGKHVLLEKPLATDMVEAQKLVHAAEHARTVVMIAENWQHAPVATAAEELIRSGAIGEPFLFSGKNLCYFDDGVSPWRLEESKSGGGVLIDAGPHTMGLARMLMGEIVDVIGMRGRPVWHELSPLEDTLGVLALFTSGATGIMEFSWRTRWREDYTVQVTGAEGTLNLDVLGGVLRLANGTTTEVRDLRANSPVFPGFFEETERFVQSVRTGAHPITSPRNESNTLAALLAVYESLRTGKRTPPPTL